MARLGGDAPAATPTASGAGDSISTAPRNTTPIDPARAIEAVASVEALVDLAVSVLETGEPADDVERVLDAVGRLAADRPEQFARLTAPIARRSRTILARRESLPFTGFDARADVAAVLLAWAVGDVVHPVAPMALPWVAGDGVHPPTSHRSVDPGAGAFLSARAREVAESAALRRPFMSVAVPTHTGGWIDPAVLVRRIAVHQPASRLDLVAGLLRLAPDGRDAALRGAAGLGGESGAVVRYALGGDEAIGPTAAWWVAAARVRAPGLDDAAVEKRHPGLGPDAGRAARILFRVRDPRPYFGGIGLEIEPSPTGDTNVDLPTVLMLRDPWSFSWIGRLEPAMLRWMATIQPGYREAWAAVGTVPIARNVDW